MMIIKKIEDLTLRVDYQMMDLAIYVKVKSVNKCQEFDYLLRYWHVKMHMIIKLTCLSTYLISNSKFFRLVISLSSKRFL